MQLIQILNILNLVIPFLFLIAILFYRLKFGEVKLRWVKAGIFTVFALFIITGAHSTIATYDLWKMDPLSRYLLPPYEATYFYGYVFFHFWLNYAIIIMLSLAWAFILWMLSRYSQSRFLDETDIHLGFFAGLVAGWPNFTFFVAIFFGLMLLRQIIDVAIYKKNEPLRVAPYLIIGAAIAMLVGDFLINKLGLGVLRI